VLCAKLTLCCISLSQQVRIAKKHEEKGADTRSVERIYAYSHIEQEQGDTEAGQPPAYWPASGDLQVHNLSARYSPNGSEVLHNLSFHLKSGERIGIGENHFRLGHRRANLADSLLVGRTGKQYKYKHTVARHSEYISIGSGKSSLTLSLLRCILTEGHVSFDGLDTSKVNLDALRSSITIIPQMVHILTAVALNKTNSGNCSLNYYAGL